MGTALVCSRWATSRGSDPAYRRCKAVGSVPGYTDTQGVVALEGKGGHCSVKSPSKPAITAAAAKTQEGGLGSGGEQRPLPNTAGPGSPRGTLGWETSSPCGKMVHR